MKPLLNDRLFSDSSHTTCQAGHFTDLFSIIMRVSLWSRFSHSFSFICSCTNVYWGCNLLWGFRSGSVVKDPPANVGVRSLGWEDPLDKDIAAHSGMIAWKIPWREEPSGLSPWGCKKSQTWLSNCSNNSLLLWALGYGGDRQVKPMTPQDLSFKGGLFMTLDLEGISPDAHSGEVTCLQL